MDNADYLNKISGGKLDKNVNPVTGHKKFQLPFGLGLNHKTFIILGAIVVLFAGLIAMNAVNSQSTMKLRGLAYSVSTRATNLDEVIKEYLPFIKNSNLRAISGDFQAVLSNFNRDFPTILGSISGASGGTKESVNTEESTKNSLKNSFTSAKMNSILDRNFAIEMGYQAEYVALHLQELDGRITNPDNKAKIQAAYNEFMTIKRRFDDWSASHK